VEREHETFQGRTPVNNFDCVKGTTQFCRNEAATHDSLIFAADGSGGYSIILVCFRKITSDYLLSFYQHD